MKYIYVAGPYTKDDPAVNTRNAILVGEEIVKMGHIPFIPHLTHFWHIIFPHEYQYWMDMDEKWLLRCDALFRMPGNSSGADIEVKKAKERGMPVYYSLEEMQNSLS